MRAARFYNVRDIRVEDVPIPQPQGNECLIEIEWNGICGSDLHIYLEGMLSCVSLCFFPLDWTRRFNVRPWTF